MNVVLKVLAGVPALGFVIMGAAWWIIPEFAAMQLGMDLLDGPGLSSQIADLGAFFLTLGVAILIGLASADRVWFYPPIMLLGLAIVGRIVAWRFHGADLATAMIAVEALVLSILVLNASRLTKGSA